MSEEDSGFCFSYEVKKSAGKGLGVFAMEPIQKGNRFWRHIPGQYIVYDEQTFKELISGMTHDEAVYELTHVFALSDFPDCVIRVLDAGVLFNHENDCNLITNNNDALETSLKPTSSYYIQDVTKALLDERYAMIATRDISVGEEFTNNYEEEVDDPPFFEILYDQYGINDTYLNDN